MQLLLLATDELYRELLSQGMRQETDLIRIGDVDDLTDYKNADALIDLLFENTPARISLLKEFLPRPVIINSVVTTLADINAPFVRINGWPGFLSRQVVEASGVSETIKPHVEETFACFNKSVEWIPDLPGFVTPVVVSMIINEAYFALGENLSTKADIDIAMKLGTNYPYGPFEWANKISLINVLSLLKRLQERSPVYQPSALLEKSV